MKFSSQLPNHSRCTINCHSFKITWQSKMHKKVLVNRGTYIHYARRYISNGMIHVQRLFREIAHGNDFRPVRYTISPIVWRVENRSTVRRVCCRWTLYPKINFQPIRTCLMHAQIRGTTVGHVSFRWTCIALHSVIKVYILSLNSVYGLFHTVFYVSTGKRNQWHTFSRKVV